MSQLSSTVFGSWGLMVGWNIAPPPPGPMISKFPGRCALPLIATKRVSVSRNKNKTIRCFPLLSLSFLRLLFGRNALLCQSSALASDPGERVGEGYFAINDRGIYLGIPKEPPLMIS